MARSEGSLLVGADRFGNCQIKRIGNQVTRLENRFQPIASPLGLNFARPENMQAEEIGLLLKQDRGQFLEFISAFEYRRSSGQKKREEELARELVRVLSGMANADGGTVLVGVEPDKSVTGVPHTGDELQTLLQAPQNL